MTQIKAGRYASHMLKFSPKIRLCMHINVMLIKEKLVYDGRCDFVHVFNDSSILMLPWQINHVPGSDYRS